jgi:hypothetical protein
MSSKEIQEQLASYARLLVADSSDVNSMRIICWYSESSTDREEVGRPYKLGYWVSDVYPDDAVTYTHKVTPGSQDLDSIEQVLVNDDEWRTLHVKELRKGYWFDNYPAGDLSDPWYYEDAFSSQELDSFFN